MGGSSADLAFFASFARRWGLVTGFAGFPVSVRLSGAVSRDGDAIGHGVYSRPMPAGRAERRVRPVSRGPGGERGLMALPVAHYTRRGGPFSPGIGRARLRGGASGGGLPGALAILSAGRVGRRRTRSTGHPPRRLMSGASPADTLPRFPLVGCLHCTTELVRFVEEARSWHRLTTRQIERGIARYWKRASLKRTLSLRGFDARFGIARWRE